jgi:hypothetical protein
MTQNGINLIGAKKQHMSKPEACLYGLYAMNIGYLYAIGYIAVSILVVYTDLCNHSNLPGVEKDLVDKDVTVPSLSILEIYTPSATIQLTQDHNESTHPERPG